MLGPHRKGYNKRSFIKFATYFLPGSNSELKFSNFSRNREVNLIAVQLSATLRPELSGVNPAGSCRIADHGFHPVGITSFHMFASSQHDTAIKVSDNRRTGSSNSKVQLSPGVLTALKATNSRPFQNT